jgi:hypothetical protein
MLLNVFIFALICSITTRLRDSLLVYAFSNRFFIYLEIMFAAFGLRYIKDFQTVPLNDYLALQRAPLFFPE